MLEAIKLVVDYRSHLGLLLFLLTIDCLLIVVDISKGKLHSEKNKDRFTILSILLCSLMMLLLPDGYIQIYYFFLLDFIYNKESKKIRRKFVVYHFAGFISAQFFRIAMLEHRELYDILQTIGLSIVIYVLILILFIIIHYYKRERQRLQMLNADIIAYGFRERDYLIEKERNLISQELHDTVGHSLMAVLMNIRYLKAISDKPQEEKDKQIEEIEMLMKESVTSLRNSVANIRKLEEDINLKEELERVITPLNNMGFIKINLSYDHKINDCSKEMKLVFYKTVKEGITNSIRHGNASRISISIHYKNDGVELILNDNGIGCVQIDKSIGLNGIEERIQKLRGNVSFVSEKNKGFTIQIFIKGGF